MLLKCWSLRIEAMRYLVDTNVFSESLKRRPSEPVLRWLRENESSLCISVITVAEIRRNAPVKILNPFDED